MDDAKDNDKPQTRAGAEAAEVEPVEKPGEGGKPKAKLTKEEQMAAFEKAMKEDDWGHQPC